MYENEIRAGMKLLDEKKPGWRAKINVSQLNMVQLSQCILGQVYGHFDTGIKDLFDLKYPLSYMDRLEAAIANGYIIASATAALYQTLGAEWVEAMRPRTEGT